MRHLSLVALALLSVAAGYGLRHAKPDAALRSATPGNTPAGSPVTT